MRPVIRHTYNVVRSIIVFFLVTVVTLYALLYILLCIPSIQQKINGIISFTIKRREKEDQYTQHHTTESQFLIRVVEFTKDTFHRIH